MIRDQFNNPSPLKPVRSLRNDRKRILTSADAGKIIPLNYAPLLRMDAVQRAQFQYQFDMTETPELLMNGVKVRLQTHVIPFMAFARHQKSMDALNRSYAGQPIIEGGANVPFFDTALAGVHGANEIYKTLGIHADATDTLNTSLIEAYNVLVNFMYKNRSPNITERALTDTSLASAFWDHSAMANIVPDFDQAMMDGEVPLQGLGNLPVAGITRVGGGTDGSGNPADMDRFTDHARIGGSAQYMQFDVAASGVSSIQVELANAGLTWSLSTLELAKKTVAFAKIREKMSGVDDDYVLDLLMAGIQLPEQEMSRPMLVADNSTLLGYNRRWATDAANLSEAVTTGSATLGNKYRTPIINSGGIVLTTAQIVPEQVFERQKDYFLYTTQVSQLPEYTRDYLDPEKVSVIENSHLDVLHATGEDPFGYAPLNVVEWDRDIPAIGGKYYRPTDDAFSEDRQRVWSNTTLNPELTADMYIVGELNNTVFASTNTDNFEIVGRGAMQISGHTHFGQMLTESTGSDYDAVLAKVDQTKIVKP